MDRRKLLEGRMRRIQALFSRFYAKVLTEKNLTIPQFSLLILVADEGPLRMNQIAERLYITSPSVTNLVDRLERERLIERTPHPEDRRAFLIEATPRGRRVVGAIRKMTVERIAGRLSSAPGREVRVMLKFFDTVGATLTDLLEKMREGKRRQGVRSTFDGGS